MNVLKRNGSIQPFDIRKILLTVERASDELNEPLTSSDIHQIEDLIQNKVSSRFSTEITSKAIHGIVLETLGELGFNSLAKAYGPYGQ